MGVKANNGTVAVTGQRRGKNVSILELLLETVLWNPLLAAATVGLQQLKRGCFLCGPCRGVILKTTGATQLVVS
jgi:hypothetical protein